MTKELDKNEAFEETFEAISKDATPERLVELVADKEYLRVWFDCGFYKGKYGEDS